MSSLGQMTVQPIGDLLRSDTAIIPNATDLKNDDSVILINSPYAAKYINDFGRGPWCFNDPERKERPTPICRALKR